MLVMFNLCVPIFSKSEPAAVQTLSLFFPFSFAFAINFVNDNIPLGLTRPFHPTLVQSVPSLESRVHPHHTSSFALAPTKKKWKAYSTLTKNSTSPSWTRSSPPSTTDLALMYLPYPPPEYMSALASIRSPEKLSCSG